MVLAPPPWATCWHLLLGLLERESRSGGRGWAGSGWPGCRGQGGGRGGDSRGCEPTPVPTEAGARVWGALPGQLALCASLTMCVTAMAAALPPRPSLVADPLTRIPSGCLLMANSSSRPESALQVPCSILEPPSAHVQAGVCRAVAQTVRVALTLLTGGRACGAPLSPVPADLPEWAGFLGRRHTCLSSAPPHCSSHPVSSPLSPFFHPPRL